MYYYNYCIYNIIIYVVHVSGYAVVQLVEALRYKPAGRWFESRWGHWDLSLTLSLRPHYGLGVDSASHRNEYPLGDKGGQRVGLTTLPHSSADCLEIFGASTSLSPV
jgi:hypothetical protein